MESAHDLHLLGVPACRVRPECRLPRCPAGVAVPWHLPSHRAPASARKRGQPTVTGRCRRATADATEYESSARREIHRPRPPSANVRRSASPFEAARPVRPPYDQKCRAVSVQVSTLERSSPSSGSRRKFRNVRTHRAGLAAISGGLLAAAAIATVSAPITDAAPVTDAAASAAAVTTTTFTPVADTFVAEYNKGGNFGARTTFAVDASAIQRAFVKFSVAGLTEPVASAKLRLHVADVAGSASDIGGSWSLMSNTTWSESAGHIQQPASDRRRPAGDRRPCRPQHLGRDRRHRPDHGQRHLQHRWHLDQLGRRRVRLEGGRCDRPAAGHHDRHGAPVVRPRDRGCG